MAYEELLRCITLKAGADLSAKQYAFMAMAADGQIDPAGEGVACVGVLQNDPDAAGRAATVGIDGVSKVQLAATLAAGAEVMADADGYAVAVTATNRSQGILLAGGVAGDIVPCLLAINGYAAAA